MPHKHTYDEHNLCFECDKPKPSRATDMKRSRAKRKALGLVEFRCYCTPQEKEKLNYYIELLRARMA